METEGFAIYDAMMQLKNEVWFMCVWSTSYLIIVQAQVACLDYLNAQN